jgi:hypothetical protein
MPNEEMGGRTIPQAPDVATTAVITAVGGFLAFVAIMMAALFFYLQAGAPGAAFRHAVENQFPAPALQTKPQADLKRFELEQRTALSGYGWADRSKGLARIPIEEAMRIIAARGDHAYDAPDFPADGATAGNPSGARP